MVKVLAAFFLIPSLATAASEAGSLLQVTPENRGWPHESPLIESSSTVLEQDVANADVLIESQSQAMLQATTVLSSAVQEKAKVYVEWAAASKMAQASHDAALVAKARAEDAASLEAVAAERATVRLSLAAQSVQSRFAASAAEGADGAAARMRADAMAIADTQHDIVAAAEVAAKAFATWEVAVQQAKDDEDHAAALGATAEAVAAAADSAWAAAGNNADLLSQRARDIPSEGQAFVEPVLDKSSLSPVQHVVTEADTIVASSVS